MAKSKRSPSMTKVYSYQPSTRNVVHVAERRSSTEIVIFGGISGQILRVAELDLPTSYYFTRPTLAIETFIAKAEAAIAAGCDAENLAAWKQALKTANWDLKITSDPTD